MNEHSNKSAQYPTIVNDLYKLVAWYLQATPKFPKSYRFGLGDRIERAALDCLETAIKAVHAKDKVPVLDRLNEGLDRLRLLTRLATDLRLLSLDQQEFCAKAIANVGKQTGGWRRSLVRPARSG